MKKILLILLIITQIMADQTITDPTTLWDSNAFMQRFAEHVLERDTFCVHAKACSITNTSEKANCADNGAHPSFFLKSHIEKKNGIYFIYPENITQTNSLWSEYSGTQHLYNCDKQASVKGNIARCIMAYMTLHFPGSGHDSTHLPESFFTSGIFGMSLKNKETRQSSMGIGAFLHCALYWY